MEMILLGTYEFKNRTDLILYSEKKGKCILLEEPRDNYIFLYSYLNKLKVKVNKNNKIDEIEILGICNVENFLKSVEFASNNLKVLNSPKENNVIIYLETLNYIEKLKEKYIVSFDYIKESYTFELSDKSVTSYLEKKESNLKTLIDYIKNSKLILVIRKNNLGETNVIKMHSIKMEMSL